MKSKLITSGLLAGLVAGTGAGLILQSTGSVGASSNGVAAVVVEDTTGTTDSGADTDSSTETRPDRSARLTEVLQPLVDDGTITAEQLTAVVAALDAAGPMGRGGDGAGGGRGMGLGGGEAATALAETLGMTTDEIRTALEGGQTLAEIATAQGVDVQTVIDTLVTAAGTHLAEEVAEGDLTQAEADAKLTEVTTRITDAVNNGGPIGGGRGGRDGHGGMGGRHGDDADDADADDADDAGAATGDVTVDSASA